MGESELAKDSHMPLMAEVISKPSYDMEAAHIMDPVCASTMRAIKDTFAVVLRICELGAPSTEPSE